MRVHHYLRWGTIIRWRCAAREGGLQQCLLRALRVTIAFLLCASMCGSTPALLHFVLIVSFRKE